MEYLTYKSRYQKQGILPYVKDGKKVFVSQGFVDHTKLVKKSDKDLIDHLENYMKMEKEHGVMRTVFTPEEFSEIMTPENAYFEHKEHGKIPFRRVTKMIDFALANGFKDESDSIEVKSKKVVQGTTTADTHIKNSKPK